MAEEAAELLEAMVPLLRIRPEIEDFCRCGGVWASPHEPRGAGWAQFHIVTRGSCVLERPGPDEIVIRTAGEPLLERLRRLLVDIRDELDGGLAGSAMIAADFARAMFVLMLRDHIGREAGGDATLSLLRDRATARVVLALLSDLARDWTLDDMAAVAVTSRATLVRAFRRLAGVAPIEFLSELRLTVARQRLAGTSDRISRIAVEVGYGSEGALSKAIIRRFGVRPGAMRLTAVGGSPDQES